MVYSYRIDADSGSQSLESNSSSGIGSLTSLRRRWLRAVSTSLGRSDSDDAFGMLHWSENGNDGRDGYRKRHKTRLGLTMLVRLAQGHERYRITRMYLYDLYIFIRKKHLSL